MSNELLAINGDDMIECYVDIRSELLNRIGMLEDTLDHLHGELLLVNEVIEALEDSRDSELLVSDEG